MHTVYSGKCLFVMSPEKIFSWSYICLLITRAHVLDRGYFSNHQDTDSKTQKPMDIPKFSWPYFRFGALHNEIKTQRKFPAIRYKKRFDCITCGLSVTTIAMMLNICSFCLMTCCCWYDFGWNRFLARWMNTIILENVRSVSYEGVWSVRACEGACGRVWGRVPCIGALWGSRSQRSSKGWSERLELEW